MNNKTNLFRNGSVWLKADFHLHTKADKEFKYDGDDNEFIKKYIQQLKNTNTSIGIITNHNKFDLEEYKALRKAALKENIFLLAGVELSVNDGSNGIHCLIAFEYESWVENKDNFIEQFLNAAFEGTANRENENTRCEYSLSDLFNKLEEHRKKGHDSFITMAHVEHKSGFYNELDGGRITQLAKDENFKRNVLAFQKLRTDDFKKKLREWFGSEQALPAMVEGSDCKKIDEIGLCGKQKDETGNEIEKETYMKIGDFNFQAVKYALIDKENRLSTNEPEFNNAYIKSIAFEGGLLDKTQIDLSPALNNFIGIRGSGKSSILEILRYTLGISLGNQASDEEYKNSLIEHVLKSGGKVIVTIVDKRKEEYRLEKIYDQKEDVYENDKRIDIPTIDTVFKRPVYFGQKDLSNKHIDFEADLVKKLIGNRLDGIKVKIDQKSSEINDVISSLKKLDNLEEHKKDIEASIQDSEYKLKIFKEKGIEDKLKLQSRFDSDIIKYNTTVSELTSFQDDLDELCAKYASFFNGAKFISEDNKDIFEQAESIFNKLIAEFTKVSSANVNVKSHIQELKNLYTSLQDKKEKLKEEFARMKREIDVSHLNPDDFLKLSSNIEISKLKLSEIDKSEKKKVELNKLLNDKVSELNQLWHEEYQTLKKEVGRINKYENSLSISVKYKGRRDKFLEKLQEIFKGSGIRTATYNTIQSKYKDFVDIYQDIENLNDNLNMSENLLMEFKNRFDSNISELITYRIDDKITIKYNDKPLGELSLGQRATALILFLLAQRETDILIIDQPEDDLDNQTIYEDVIKEIKSLKGNMQFIFATHNANIPVLGDSEKIVSCKYLESKIETTTGTIDNGEMQRQVVTIMEGGKEAFNRRKNVYELWSLKK